MKQTLIAAALTLLLLACKKETESPVEHKKSTYTVRVEAQGKDGSVYYSNEAYYANQNGGQSGSNEFCALTYAGYGNGYYVLDLQNKQACGIDFDVSWLHKDTTIYVPASSTKTIQLPGVAKGSEKIKARPLYRCGSSGGDLGWVEIETPENLPVKFKSIHWEELQKGKLKIVFSVTECREINVFNIQLRLEEGKFKNVAMVFPDDTKIDATYSLTINL